MQIVKRYPGALAAVLALAVMAACTDKAGGPAGPGGPTPPTAPPGDPVTLQALSCTASVKGKSVVCTTPKPGINANADAILVGGQNLYVTLTSTNVDYVAATQQFTFDVTVRNLIPQPMGTVNATTLAADPLGIRVFFHDVPTATAGTGAIVVNGDGIETFTKSGQPYYQYNTVLEQYEVSAPKTWNFTVPATVESFSFLLFISTPVPYPNGWIEVDGNSNVRSGTTRQLTAIARTRVGRIIPLDSVGPITWGTADGNLATVTTTGLVKGLRSGTVEITATDTAGRTGDRPMNVIPIRRIWTGVADNNWQNGNNWLPDSIVPTPQDTAYVHADSVAAHGGTQYPTLTANASVGGVEVFAAPAKISLAAFDLTATGDVFAEFLPSPGVIDNTTGRLILAGTARTVRGTLPRVLVSGTYSLTGNINTRAPLQVNAGRLTNGTFRIQTVSN